MYAICSLWKVWGNNVLSDSARAIDSGQDDTFSLQSAPWYSMQRFMLFVFWLFPIHISQAGHFKTSQSYVYITNIMAVNGRLQKSPIMIDLWHKYPFYKSATQASWVISICQMTSIFIQGQLICPVMYFKAILFVHRFLWNNIYDFHSSDSSHQHLQRWPLSLFKVISCVLSYMA